MRGHILLLGVNSVIVTVAVLLGLLVLVYYSSDRQAVWDVNCIPFNERRWMNYPCWPATNRSNRTVFCVSSFRDSFSSRYKVLR